MGISLGPAVARWDRPVRLTPFHREHLARGADLVERDNWLLPRSYGDPEGERSTLRVGAGLLDISEQGKVDLKGREVEALLRDAFSAMGSAAVGARAEGLGDDPLIYGLTSAHALVVTSSGATQRTFARLSAASGDGRCGHVTDVTGSLCGLRLLGPRAPDVLQWLSSLDLAPDCFAEGRCTQGAVARIHALVARRDAAGLPGYDLYVDRDLGAYLWEALLGAGAPLDLRPVGRAAEEGWD